MTLEDQGETVVCLFIGVLRLMQRYFSHICDGTKMCRRTEV